MADFATVAELESFMGTTGLGARGTAILGYASAQIRRYTGQDLEVTAGRQEEFAGEWNRNVITVQQLPITALTSITVDLVAFTDFWANYLTGDIYRTDAFYWTEGPILVTYDSGYDAASDEMASVKAICLEMATRAISGTAGVNDTFGPEVAELRGGPVGIFLTDSEKSDLDGLRKVPVG